MNEYDSGSFIELSKGIANAIQQTRQEAGLSQSELAMMVGVDQSVISKYEKHGKKDYSLQMIFRIFDSMNIDIEFSLLERDI